MDSSTRAPQRRAFQLSRRGNQKPLKDICLEYSPDQKNFADEPVLVWCGLGGGGGGGTGTAVGRFE